MVAGVSGEWQTDSNGSGRDGAAIASNGAMAKDTADEASFYQAGKGKRREVTGRTS